MSQSGPSSPRPTANYVVLASLFLATASLCGSPARATDPKQLPEAQSVGAQRQYQRSRAAWEQGDEDEAIKAADRAVELAPNTPYLHAWKATIYSQYTDDFKTALAEATRFCELAPRSASYNLKSEVLMRMQKYPEALEAANQALKITPVYSGTYETKANILVRLGKMQEAEDCAKSAPPGSATDVQMLRADIAKKLKHWPIVIDQTTQIISTKAKHVPLKHQLEARLMRATAYEALKDYAKAKKDYAEALAVWPDSREVHVAAEQFYERIGDTAQAKREKQEIKKIDCDFKPY